MAQILYNKNFDINNIPTEPVDLLDYAIDRNITDKIMLVLPTGKLHRKFEIDFIRRIYERSGKATGRLKLHSLKSFFTFCFDKFKDDENYHLISDAYRLALFEEAIDNSELNYFGQNTSKISQTMTERLNGLIYGLREEGIDSEQMQKDLSVSEEKSMIFDPVKFEDIKVIMQNYEASLDESILDYPKMLKLLDTHLSESYQERFDETIPSEITKSNSLSKKIFEDVDIVLFYSFSDFSVLELSLISHFVSMDTALAINLDFSEKNGPLFGNILECIEKLESSGYKRRNTNTEVLENEVKHDDYSVKNDLYLRSWLFNTKVNTKNPNFSSSIKIFETDDIDIETEAIAKYIKHKILVEDYSPADICIVSRQASSYAENFMDVFFEMDIPVNISDRYNLSSSYIINTILGLIELVVYKYHIDNFEKLANNPLLLNEKIDLNNFHLAGKKLRLKSGLKGGGARAWKIKISKRLETIDELIKSHNKDDREYLILKNEKEFYLQLDNNLDSLLKLLDVSYLSPRGFKNYIINIISSFNMRENLLKNLKLINNSFLIDELERESRALEKFLSLLDEFILIIEDRHPQEEFSLDFYFKKLKSAVNAEKYQILEKFNHGITVTSIEQVRGLNYKILILCGATDGEFPLKYNSDFFLGKELKKSEIRHYNSEKLLFYQFLTHASNENTVDEYVISYPLNIDEKEKVRSSFIDELLKITTLEEDNRIISINNDYDEEWFSNICSESELHKHLSDNIKFINNKEYISNNILDISETSFSINTTDKLINYLESKHSISELEEYINCPFKFSMSRILRLNEEDEFETFLSSKDHGTLIHNVLYEFYTQVRIYHEANNFDNDIKMKSGEKLKLIHLHASLSDKYRRILKEAIETESKKIQYDHPFFSLEIEELLGSDHVKGILFDWMEKELIRFDDDFKYKPVLFEYAFGYDKDLKISDKLKIKGKIDRIDLYDAGDHYEFLIIDYKRTMGSTKSFSDIYNGKSLQMPIYGLAIKKLLSEELDKPVYFSGAVYYVLKYTDDVNYKVALFNYKSMLSDYFELSSRSLNKIDDKANAVSIAVEHTMALSDDLLSSIIEGNFERTEDDSACTFCNFSTICRKYEKE